MKREHALWNASIDAINVSAPSRLVAVNLSQPARAKRAGQCSNASGYSYQQQENKLRDKDVARRREEDDALEKGKNSRANRLVMQQDPWSDLRESAFVVRHHQGPNQDRYDFCNTAAGALLRFNEQGRDERREASDIALIYRVAHGEKGGINVHRVAEKSFQGVSLSDQLLVSLADEGIDLSRLNDHRELAQVDERREMKRDEGDDPWSFDDEPSRPIEAAPKADLWRSDEMRAQAIEAVDQADPTPWLGQDDRRRDVNVPHINDQIDHARDDLKSRDISQDHDRWRER